MSAQRFAHLHLHSQYSILDGAIGITPLMEHLRQTGMSAAALTDHGNLFGAVEFQLAARRAGVKPILGCEVYVAQTSRFDRDPETGGWNGINHLVLLAMNETGYRNLVRLVSKGYLEGFYYKPRVDMELLAVHNEGLIATSGCLSSMVPNAILRGQTSRAWELLEAISQTFRDRYYLELQRHGIPDQDVVNEELLRMHRELGIPLVATNDCHYLHPHDARPHEALLCVQTGKTLDDPKRFRFTGDGFWVKTPAEMAELFGDLPEALAGTLEVAERCDFELETGGIQLPDFQLPPGESADSYLARLSGSGLAERLVGDPDRPLGPGARESAYAERLRYELDVISRCGYSAYFLIVWDFIRFARQRGIPVGPGRGSSAGSLVAWALRIVDIDPVEYGIAFERFLNPERVSMPDIDVDFCMNRRGEVIRYVEEKYNGVGDDGRRVSGIVTFGTMQAKAALRDVGRVLGIPFGEVDRVAKLVPEVLGITLEDALSSSRELRSAVDRDPRIRQLFELARALEGQIRNPGKHAAGIVISSRPLLETVPLYRDPRTREIATQFDWRAIEKIGLIKFDLLGLRTLTIVHDAVRRVREAGWADFSVDQMPLDDRETYDLLCRGETKGVFQIGLSNGAAELVVKLQPREFRDVIPLLGLQRPGPLKSGMVDDYVARRHGRAPIEYPLPELEEILAETYGVIVYQDQVLQLANRLASYTLGEGDLLRRAMGKKIPAEMEQQRQRFLEGCEKNGHPRRPSQQIFDLMNQFAGYGFPKAHSAAYALITHQTAYLKAHHPAEFYAATMTAECDELDRLDTYMRDAATRGIEMKPPCINESVADFMASDGGRVVRFGLAGVKNVGEGAVEAILEARRRGSAFRSLHDFCERVDSRRVNRRVFESLVRCGAFDCFKATRASLWEVLPSAMEHGQKLQRDRASGQRSLFADLGPAAEPELPEVPEWPSGERLAAEKEILGFYVTGHPLEAHRDELERFASARTDGLADCARGQPLRMVGVITQLRTRKTRGGNLMARAVLEDLSGTANLVVFPKVFDRYAELLRSGDPLLVRGSLGADADSAELQLDEAMPLANAWRDAVRELVLRIQADRVSSRRLGQLREILDLAPGEVPVSVLVLLPDGVEALLELTRHRVSVSAELVGRLDALFGAKVAECCL